MHGAQPKHAYSPPISLFSDDARLKKNRVEQAGSYAFAAQQCAAPENNDECG
jgi:hypothetical protein